MFKLGPYSLSSLYLVYLDFNLVYIYLEILINDKYRNNSNFKIEFYIYFHLIALFLIMKPVEGKKSFANKVITTAFLNKKVNNE